MDSIIILISPLNSIPIAAQGTYDCTSNTYFSPIALMNKPDATR